MIIFSKYKIFIPIIEARRVLQQSGPDGGWLLTTWLSISAYNCNKAEHHDEQPMYDSCIEEVPILSTHRCLW